MRRRRGAVWLCALASSAAYTTRRLDAERLPHTATTLVAPKAPDVYDDINNNFESNPDAWAVKDSADISPTRRREESGKESGKGKKKPGLGFDFLAPGKWTPEMESHHLKATSDSASGKGPPESGKSGSTTAKPVVMPAKSGREVSEYNEYKGYLFRNTPGFRKHPLDPRVNDRDHWDEAIRSEHAQTPALFCELLEDGTPRVPSSNTPMWCPAGWCPTWGQPAKGASGCILPQCDLSKKSRPSLMKPVGKGAPLEEDKSEKEARPLRRRTIEALCASDRVKASGPDQGKPLNFDSFQWKSFCIENLFTDVRIVREDYKDQEEARKIRRSLPHHEAVDPDTNQPFRVPTVLLYGPYPENLAGSGMETGEVPHKQDLPNSVLHGSCICACTSCGLIDFCYMKKPKKKEREDQPWESFYPERVPPESRDQGEIEQVEHLFQQWQTAASGFLPTRPNSFFTRDMCCRVREDKDGNAVQGQFLDQIQCRMCASLDKSKIGVEDYMSYRPRRGLFGDFSYQYNPEGGDLEEPTDVEEKMRDHPIIAWSKIQYNEYMSFLEHGRKDPAAADVSPETAFLAAQGLRVSNKTPKRHIQDILDEQISLGNAGPKHTEFTKTNNKNIEADIQNVKEVFAWDRNNLSDWQHANLAWWQSRAPGVPLPKQLADAQSLNRDRGSSINFESRAPVSKAAAKKRPISGELPVASKPKLEAKPKGAVAPKVTPKRITIVPLNPPPAPKAPNPTFSDAVMEYSKFADREWDNLQAENTELKSEIVTLRQELTSAQKDRDVLARENRVLAQNARTSERHIQSLCERANRLHVGAKGAKRATNSFMVQHIKRDHPLRRFFEALFTEISDVVLLGNLPGPERDDWDSDSEQFREPRLQDVPPREDDGEEE